MRLPEEFMKQMKEELGEEFPAFLACCEEPAWRGLRFNGMKTGDWEREALGRPVSWCAKGRCLDPAEAEALAPGKHPLYFAGAYYIQEPSSMLPAQLVDPGRCALLGRGDVPPGAGHVPGVGGKGARFLSAATAGDPV